MDYLESHRILMQKLVSMCKKIPCVIHFPVVFMKEILGLEALSELCINMAVPPLGQFVSLSIGQYGNRSKPKIVLTSFET